MDKKKSFLNIGVSIFFKFFMIIGVILTRRYLIQYIGNEANGLESLYVSVIGVLSVAELGAGSAISFCMYKPIVEGDLNKVAALYQLFKRWYRAVGLIIFTIGILLMPVLPILAKDYLMINESLYGTFFLILLSVVPSYLFGAKTALINAYKDNYITITIHSAGILLQYALQILIVVVTRSFTWYLGCRTVSIVAQWIATEVFTRRRHMEIVLADRKTLDLSEKKRVYQNIKAMFMHKIGAVLVNSADNIIISAFIGVVLLGKYTNYTSIVAAMTAVIALFFTPLTAIIGQLFVSDPEQAERYYQFFCALNYVIAVIFFLGYYAVVDELVLLLFGEGLELTRSVSFVITINYFVQFMRQSTLLFRDATGTFYNDRWKPLAEGLLNIVISVVAVIVLSKGFGDEVGLVGVIVATIITNLLICHIVEPYVLCTYAFHSSAKPIWKRNYSYILVFIVVLFVESRCMQMLVNPVVRLLVNGGISLLFSLLIVIGVFLTHKEFRYYVKKICSKAEKKLRN